MCNSKKALDHHAEPLDVRPVAWAAKWREGNGRITAYSMAHLATRSELTRANDPRNDARTFCGVKIPRYTKLVMDEDTMGRKKCRKCKDRTEPRLRGGLSIEQSKSGGSCCAED